MSERPILPLDVWIKVVRTLDPMDILKLRKCSKLLHDVTHTKVVWIDALLRVCRQYGASTKTFPMADMTQSELEDATLSPYRWQSLISRRFGEIGSASSYPLSIHELRPPPLDDNSGGSQTDRLVPPVLKSFALAPGGRYLFASMQMGDTDAGMLHAWDLGNKPLSEGSPPKIIASLSLDGIHTDLQTHIVEDFCRILVLTRVRSVLQLYIYHLDPDAGELKEVSSLISTSLTEIWSIDQMGDFDTFFKGDLVALGQFEVVLLWSAMENAAVI